MSVVTAALYGWLGDGRAKAAEPAPAVTLLVAFEGEPNIEATRLRDALAEELGRPVVLDAGAEGGTLDIRKNGAQAVVYFEAADGRRTGRSVALPSDPEEAIVALTLLAENLMQDSSAFLTNAENERVDDAGEPGTGDGSSPGACHGSPELPLGMDFAPYLGASSTQTGRDAGRSFSFGLIAALYGGLEGVALSGTANVDTGSACGLELAGVANVTRGSVSGLQLAGVANIAGDVHGAQISGTLNVASQMSGLQLGAVGVTSGRMRGAQIGVVNYAEETDFTLGVVNVTSGRVRGVQVGVINYAYDTDFSLGIVNIVAAGRWNVEAWALPESGMVLAGVKHGGAHFHNVYGVGMRPEDVDHVWALLGVGAHITPAEALFFDTDLVSHTEIASSPNHLIQARLRLGYRLGRNVAGLLGPTFNLLLAEDGRRTGTAPGYRFELRDTPGLAVLAWPGIALGVEVN